MLNILDPEAGIGEPDHAPINCEFRLPVYVVFTSIDATLKALQKAQNIAGILGAGIVILAIQVVPFPLPLNEPPVSMEFIIKRFEEKAGGLPEKTSISAYLCRDSMETLCDIIDRDCPVVIGFAKRWWPTYSERLARKLRRVGYDVMSDC